MHVAAGRKREFLAGVANALPGPAVRWRWNVTSAQESPAGSGPTVLRIQLGMQLRRLRESKGVSRENAGWEIRSSESKISRMELGRVSFKERDVADLLTLYGVTGEERETLIALARRANTPGWWQD